MIFIEMTLNVPKPYTDTTVSEMEEEMVQELSLEFVIKQFLNENPEEIPAEREYLLPCRSNTLLFRTANGELIRCLYSRSRKQIRWHKR